MRVARPMSVFQSILLLTSQQPRRHLPRDATYIGKGAHQCVHRLDTPGPDYSVFTRYLLGPGSCVVVRMSGVVEWLSYPRETGKSLWPERVQHVETSKASKESPRLFSQNHGANARVPTLNARLRTSGVGR